MAIRMDLTGSDTALFNGKAYKAKNPIFTLARKLQSDGFEDQQVEVYRDETLCFREPLSKLAYWTTQEEPSLRFSKYRPFEGIESN